MKKKNGTKNNEKASSAVNKSSALAAASKGRTATGNVKANSSRDVNGNSGLRNTGTNVDYE